VCALAIVGSLVAPSASANEWRRAGTSAWQTASAVVQAQAVADVDPFEGSAASQMQPAGGPRGEASVVQRGDEVPAGFDPFEEHLNDDDAAMPAADEARPGAVSDQGFDPFEADDRRAGEREPTRDEVIKEPEAAPVAESSNGFNAEEAFGEPRRGVAVGPTVEQQLEDAQGAVEEEMERRDRDDRREAEGDAAEDRDDPFTTEDALDAPDRQGDRSLSDDVEEQTGDDEEFDADDLQEQFQQAPGGFDIRPLDGSQSPGLDADAEAAARRREVENQQIEAERIKTEETCEEFLANVKADNIRTVSLAIRLEGRAGEDYPFDCGLGNEQFQPRRWAQTTYLWKAAGLCHKPLYFEQVQMERYGHSWGPVLDPLVCGAHFFGSVPVLPYKMGITTPNECVYTLGCYRPGSCAPYMIPAVPFTWRAAAFEAGVWTGGAFAIP
jgi:hypothetical protein